MAEHTLETVMTDHRFETHEPVALYVELGSGQIDVTLEGADHVELRSTTVSGDVVLTKQ